MGEHAASAAAAAASMFSSLSGLPSSAASAAVARRGPHSDRHAHHGDGVALAPSELVERVVIIRRWVGQDHPSDDLARLAHVLLVASVEVGERYLAGGAFLRKLHFTVERQ